MDPFSQPSAGSPASLLPVKSDVGSTAAPRFSDDLRAILGSHAKEGITIGEFEAAMKGRGFAVLLIIFTIPFCLPLPLPGLSSPFGLAILLIGARLGMGMRPWLPAFVLRRKITPEFLQKLIPATIRIVAPLEKIIRPRLGILFFPGARHLVGWSIALGGLLLCLPLPIPFTNVIPAVPVLLLALGLMERDGMVLLAGYVLLAVAVASFGAMAYFGTEGVMSVIQHLT